MSSDNSFTPNVESASGRIIHEISDQTGVDPLDLAPLNDYIDTDAIDSLLGSTPTKKSRKIQLEFHYDGYEVTVFQDERLSIHVREAEANAGQDSSEYTNDTE